MIPLALCAFCFIPLIHAEDYKGPFDLVSAGDGSKIYIANADANEVAVFDVAGNKIVQSIPLGAAPHGLALSADEKTLFVSAGSVSGQLLAVDLIAGKVSKNVPAGHSPMGLALTPDGKKVFVCNRFNNDVAEYGLPDLNLIRKVKVIREPRVAVVTKDGQYVLIANSIPLDRANDPENQDALIDVAAEISAIKIADGTVKNIRLPNGSGSLHGICLSPDGRYAYISEVLARFQIPTTQVDRGWMNTAAFSIIDTTQIDTPSGGFINAVLLDDVDLGAANPWGIKTSVDGKQLYIAAAGTNELIVIDTEALHKKLDTLPKYELGAAYGTEQTNPANDVPNDLAFLVGLKKRIKLNGKGARAIAVAGQSVYVGMYFSDTLQKVDAQAAIPKVTEIAIGPTPVMTPERRGEMYWNDATLCFQLWQSCASCHPEARMDGYNWDLLNDGLGNPKNAKSLLYCLKTPPSMWEGVRDPIDQPEKWKDTGKRIQCVRTGFQFILFATPDEEKCLDIDAYLRVEEPVPSPYLVNGKLSEKAERGKKIFNDPKVGCATCHPEPLFTDQKMHDVNTKCYFDRTGSFDTPTLIETWRTAPYLHDGRYTKMKDVFKIGLHGDVEGGNVSDLTDTQIDDLVEYVLSL
jgi:YVTN family beta-propeller protein